MRKLCLAVLLLLTYTGFTQSWPDTLQKIDKLFSIYAHVPGAQLAISRHGKVIFSGAWGMADMEHNTPLTTTCLTEAGSVSKQFTAACILLLEQQGKLSLEDNVRKWVPELPDYGTPVLLRHLMHHTSGIKDWGAVAGIAGWPRFSAAYDNNDALQIMSRQQSLNNKPGAEFIYSNSNYNLFAIIIQRVSGLSLAAFSRKYIFDPAGMRQTQWRDDYKRIVKNRAIGYERTPGGYETSMPNEYVYGNGGLLTTAEELLQWNRYYLSGQFGSPSLLAKQLSRDLLPSGRINGYGAGLFIDSTNGWQDINHNGATAGYRSDLHSFPELGLSIAWLSNNTMPVAVVNGIINLFAVKKTGSARPVALPAAPTATFRLPAGSIKKYAGRYRDGRTGSAYEITARDSGLMMQNLRFTATSPTRFAAGKNVLDFRKNGVEYVNAFNDTLFFEAVPEADLSADALQQYTGTYASGETASELTILWKDGKLFLKNRPSSVILLTPLYKDGFGSEEGIVCFEKDKTDRVTILRIFTNRARNIVFKKVQEDRYKLVWSDEFNTDGVPDPANWRFERGLVRNHEYQWYQPDNARISNGILTIEAKKESIRNPDYVAGSSDWRKKDSVIAYTSSSISTLGKRSWQYGRFELRARIDTSMGLWPAWWTLGTEHPWPSNGEIDIMEYYRQSLLANIAVGTTTPYKAHWFSTKKPISSFEDHADWAGKFHVWRMDWDENDISLWIDGILLNKQSMKELYNRDSTHTHPFRQPHYMLLNLAVGGDNGGDPKASPSPFPKKYEIDYVRVYRLEHGF